MKSWGLDHIAQPRPRRTNRCHFRARSHCENTHPSRLANNSAAHSSCPTAATVCSCPSVDANPNLIQAQVVHFAVNLPINSPVFHQNKTNFTFDDCANSGKSYRISGKNAAILATAPSRWPKYHLCIYYTQKPQLAILTCCRNVNLI